MSVRVCLKSAQVKEKGQMRNFLGFQISNSSKPVTMTSWDWRQTKCQCLWPVIHFGWCPSPPGSTDKKGWCGCFSDLLHTHSRWPPWNADFSYVCCDATPPVPFPLDRMSMKDSVLPPTPTCFHTQQAEETPFHTVAVHLKCLVAETHALESACGLRLW